MSARNKFVPLRDPSGNELKYGLIKNSVTLAEGEAIIPERTNEVSIVNTGGGTTGALLGVVRSIVGKDGKVLEKNSHAAASDNQTVAMVQVSYVPLFVDMEYAGTLDADPGTTTGSTAYGNFAIDSTGLLVDESTYTAFTTVIAKQFFSYGLIPGTDREVTGMFIKKIGFTA